MGRKAASGKKTIQRKFYYAMLGNTLLALIVLMVGMCVVFAIYYLRFESVSSQNQLGYIAQQIDYLRSSIENFAKTVRSETAVQQILKEYDNGTDSNWYGRVNDASTRMYNIIQAAPFIHSVSIYGADGGLLVSTDNRPVNKELDAADQVKAARWVLSQKYEQSGTSRLQAAFSYLSPCYNIDNGAFLGYVEITLPEYRVSDIFRPYTTGHFSILVTDRQGLIRSHEDKALIGESYPLFNELELQKGSGGNSRVILFGVAYAPFGWVIINEISIAGFFEPLRSVMLLLVLLSAACILLDLATSVSISRTITSPLQQLVNHTDTIRLGRWTTVDSSVATDRDTRTLFHAFNKMIVAQETLKNNLVETERNRALLSLSSLQQQINPHFLYNSLDNIVSLTELEEYDTAIAMTMSLSAFYRKSLNQGKMVVTVQDELAITENYLKIMQIRKHGRFDYEIYCEAGLSHCLILKLLLQPIVENSIEHGFGELNRKGFIKIAVSGVGPEALLIEVADNGLGMAVPFTVAADSSAPEHYGLFNIDQRIKLYCGLQFGLQIENIPAGGCRTLLHIKREETANETLSRVNC